jgi:hypothetical protein
MKIIKYLGLVLIIVTAFSCTKNTIEYNAEPMTGTAEFQLHYYVPVTSVTANNINKILVNGKLYSNIKAPITPYNAAPGGSVGRFFDVAPGTVNLKLYQGANDSVPYYNKNVTLSEGKQNVFVHDTGLVANVYSNGFPYVGNVTKTTDSTAWVKFYNILYETAGVKYTTYKLQYQYVDSRFALPVNIGPPVAFGETTGWCPVYFIKDALVSQGSKTITFKIKTVDASGNIIGDLSVMGTTGAYAAYTGTLSLTIGRRYHQVMAGFRAVKSPNSSVRTFTAL